MPGPGGSSMPSSACGSRSRSELARGQQPRRRRADARAPLQLHAAAVGDDAASTFALRSAPLRSTTNRSGGAMPQPASSEREQRRSAAPPHTTTSRASPISRRKRGVESTPSSRASTSARAAPVVSTAAAQAQMRQSGQLAPRCRAARRASARTSRGPARTAPASRRAAARAPAAARRAAARAPRTSRARAPARPRRRPRRAARARCRGGRGRPDARMTAIMLPRIVWTRRSTPAASPARCPPSRPAARWPRVPPGAALIVLATDPEAPIDVAAVAADAGCTFAAERDGGGWRLTLRAGSTLSRQHRRRAEPLAAPTCAPAERRGVAVARARRPCASPPPARPRRPAPSPRSPRSAPARRRAARPPRGTCPAPACRARPRRRRR